MLVLLGNCSQTFLLDLGQVSQRRADVFRVVPFHDKELDGHEELSCGTNCGAAYLIDLLFLVGVRLGPVDQLKEGPPRLIPNSRENRHVEHLVEGRVGEAEEFLESIVANLEVKQISRVHSAEESEAHVDFIYQGR